MVEIRFSKTEDQNSRRTGAPLAKNVRYEEEGSSYFKEFYFPKNLLQAANDGEIPETVTLTVS